MNTITTILKLIPSIIEAIKAIEAAIPGSGKGEQKLAAIRQILEAIDGTITNIWPQLAATIGILVKLLNDTGVFTKKA